MSAISGIAENPLNRIGSIVLQEGERKKIVSDISNKMRASLFDIIKNLNSQDISGLFLNKHGFFNINLKKEDKRIVLLLDNKNIDLVEEAAGRFFQDLMESRSAVPICPYRDACYKMVQKKTELKRQAKSTADSLPEMVAVSSDLLSIVRNSASVSTPNALSVSTMGITGGALTTVSGAIMVANGFSDARASGKIGDSEGVALGSLYASTGACLSGVGVGMVVNKAAAIHGMTTLAATASSAVITPLFIATDLFLLGYASCQLHHARTFRESLHESMNEQGLRGGIEYLHEQLNLTDTDKKKLKQIENFTERQSEMDRMLQRKWARFERRTDSETLQSILPKIGVIKEKLDAGKVDETVISDAKNILETVLRANYKKIVRSALLIVVALTGLAAIIAAMIFGGIIPVIIFAILGGMWLILDKSGGTDFIAEGFWKIHKKLLDLFGSSVLPKNLFPIEFVKLANGFVNENPIQEHLEAEILKGREIIEIKGQKITLFEQIVADYRRYPRMIIIDKCSNTRYEYESATEENNKGEEILLTLRDMVPGDEGLFFYLAALLSQTSGNYAVKFLPFDGMEAAYTWSPKREMMTFTKKPDGSFEILVRMNIGRKHNLGEEPDSTLGSYNALYRLEKKDGTWSCRQPVYSL